MRALVGAAELLRREVDGVVARVLDEAARRFINNARGVRIEDGELIVSSIYAWFRDDFGGSKASVLSHLRTYADADLKAALSGRTDIDGYGYDWDLNGD